eukprot:gene11689-24475_t
MSNMINDEPISFRKQSMASVFDILKSAIVISSVGFIKPGPANAANALETANSKLGDYNLPPILFVPPGFNPIVSEYGRGNAKSAISNPIIVQFCAPQAWIVEKTTVNNNGESGKIAANDYVKGDSAFMFVTPLPSGSKLELTNKLLMETTILK